MFLWISRTVWLLRWLSGKESACQCRRHRRDRFNPWVGKIPLRGKWQPTVVLWPEKFYGQRSLAGYNPWGCKESDMTEHACTLLKDQSRALPHKLWWGSNHRHPRRKVLTPSRGFRDRVVPTPTIAVVVQLPSRVWLFVIPWTAAGHASLSLTMSWSLPNFMSIASVMPCSHLILRCPLLLRPSIFPSIREFSNELSVRIRWPEYWRFSFSISPSSEYSGLISLKIDWFDLLAIQGTFRSLPQHHSSKALILWSSAFFMVQLSQPYVTTGKSIALTLQTFVSRVMSLLFNTLSRFVISFLPRSNCLLISWLQLPFTVILEPKKRKSVTTYTFSPAICHAVMGPDAMILVFLNI